MSPSTDPREYDAIVYDLDTTLAQLAVNWKTVATELDAALRDAGLDLSETTGVWAMLDLATDTDNRDVFEEVVCSHECVGAERAWRREAAARLPHDQPVGVCSLNCERACRRALDVVDLAEDVDVVVGRTTIPAYKPDPEPLCHVCAELDVAPENAVFVGDSPSDATTAERAGVPFVGAAEWAAGGQ